jgi:uncharacterized RDD family membrane protein YckC
VVRDTYVIRTPENVTFEFELAGLGARALAWGIDLAIMFVALIVGSFVVAILATATGGLALALFSVFAFLVQWWYSALAEHFFRGRTIGKMLVGLRTLSDRGTRITFLQAVVRNLVRVVDILPALYLTGGVSALLDRHGRRLGDIVAGTIVVRERRLVPPSAVVPESERYNTFIHDPEVAIAARRITPPERDAMVALGLRREELPLSTRHELFARMSKHLEVRLGLTRPAYFSEEKFVLHLTAVVLGQAEERRSLPPTAPIR